MDLYHDYERTVGAFKNLSELDMKDAQTIQSGLTGVYAAQRNERYLFRRKHPENAVRELFIQKGGAPQRLYIPYDNE